MGESFQFYINWIFQNDNVLVSNSKISDLKSTCSYFPLIYPCFTYKSFKEHRWNSLHLVAWRQRSVSPQALLLYKEQSQFPQRHFVGCCWEKILWGFLTFLHILWAEAYTAIVPRNFFQQCKIKSLRRWKQCFPQNKKEASLLPIIKDPGSQNLEFLSCRATHCKYNYHLALFALPCGNWGWGKVPENLIFWDLILLSVIKSFISGPGAAWLLPAPMKLSG